MVSKHGHLFFSDHEHIRNNIRADPYYRGANTAIRRQLEAELQTIHDLNWANYEPKQTALSNNEPTVNHTSDAEPGLSSSNSTLPTQEQPTTKNIDTGPTVHNTPEIPNRGARGNSNDKATADSDEGTGHRTDNTNDGHSREEEQSNSTPPATDTVWPCPICGTQAETNVIECPKCLNWLHYKCERMTESTYRTHASNNDLEYNCKSCTCMKEMNELAELFQRGDKVEERIIDTTTNNILTTEESNPKNVIVNTNTIDEMEICEETGLKCLMP